MIGNELLSKKVILGIVLLAIAAGAVLYFSSPKKSAEIVSPTNNSQPANSTSSVSDQSKMADNAAPVQQETTNASSTSKPSQAGSNEIDMSDWKTYTNKDYGYELKYPSTWYINLTEAGNNPEILYVEIEKPSSEQATRSGLEVEIFKNGYVLPGGDDERLDDNTDLVYFYRIMNGLFPDEYFQKTKKQTFKVGDIEAFRYVDGNSFSDTPWMLRRGGAVYSFGTSGSDNIRVIAKDIFNTFTFIDSSK